MFNKDLLIHNRRSFLYAKMRIKSLLEAYVIRNVIEVFGIATNAG